jgi:hypothetical protein
VFAHPQLGHYPQIVIKIICHLQEGAPSIIIFVKSLPVNPKIFKKKNKIILIKILTQIDPNLITYFFLKKKLVLIKSHNYTYKCSI